MTSFAIFPSVCGGKLKCSADVTTCGEHEQYTKCGSGCGDLTCEYMSYANLICPAVCRQGCFCINGFVRNNGKCILSEQCKVKCPLNEHSTLCDGLCQPTCDVPNPICTKICVKGCACDKGFIRNKKGKCIRSEKCREGEKSASKSINAATLLIWIDFILLM